MSVSTQTIAAISTPPGSGGIGIIRISGNQSLPVLKNIFNPVKGDCTFESHKFFYGHIVEPQTSRILDEVLVVYMRSPNSYTREDVVEVHCHGSFLVLQNILELILSHGVELADPGEFTKRAFLNGRIDLTKAEAVIDILSARTRKGVDIAQQQLSGALYKRINTIRKSLTEMRAVIEVAIDFPDEDIEIIDHTHLIEQLGRDVIVPLKSLLASADHGKIYREGILVVIAGLPNVGKSSLLNTLLQEERALVTEIPGTTRDTIEEYIDVHGMPVRIVDTAGIRDEAEQVEELGIKRAKNLINEADLVLFMVDGERGIESEDIKLFESVNHKPLVLVLNKTDIAENEPADIAELEGGFPVIEISAKEQTGIDDLKEAIFARVTGGKEQWEEESCAPNVRHKRALQQACEASKRIDEALALSLTTDLIAVDLQECLDQLGAIVGETTTEDILDVIFEQFCLGK